jgi:hypothetical protein
MPGPSMIQRVTAYWNEVAIPQQRVVIQGADDSHVKLPTGDDPTGILGISKDDTGIGDQSAIVMEGDEWAFSAGACTAGGYARVMNTGTVQDVATNATPVAQPVIGQFLTSADDEGQLVLVAVRPGQITK